MSPVMSTLLNLILLACGWMVIVAGGGFYKRKRAVVRCDRRQFSGANSGHVARCCRVSQFRDRGNRSCVRARIETKQNIYSQ
jgi:hypothetical protein